MPQSIGPTDIRGGLNQTIGNYDLPLPGSGQAAFGHSLEGLGDTLARFVVDAQMRHNELVVQDADLKLREVRRNLLLGDGRDEPGALNVRDMGVVGISQRTGDRMMKHLEEIEGTLENESQKRAFRTQGGKLIASALDTLAAHEADASEKLRVARVDANYNEEMAHVIAVKPTAFLEKPSLPGDSKGTSGPPDTRLEILKLTEDYILATNLSLDDKTVESLARVEMANRAHQAALSHLEKGGAAAVSDGRKFLQQYKSLWSPQQSQAIQAAVDHQIGLQLMLDVASEVMADAQTQGYEDDSLKQRNEARKRFQSRYRDPERGAGKDAPPEMVDEMSRRMLAENALVRASAKQKREARVDATIGGFVKVISDLDATADQKESAYRQALADLDPTDASALRILNAFADNFEETRSPFAPAMTVDGWQAFTLTDQQLRQMDQTTLWDLTSKMDASHAEKFIDRHRSANGKPGEDQTGRLTSAINSALARSGKKGLKPKSIELGVLLDSMQDVLESRRQSGEKAPPTMPELIDLASVLRRSLDDSFIDYGNTQTVQEFLSNPEPVDLRDDEDAAFVGMARFFLASSPEIEARVYQQIGSTEEAEVAKFLASDPQFLRDLIRFGLSSSERFEAFYELERRRLVSGEEEGPSIFDAGTSSREKAMSRTREMGGR